MMESEQFVFDASAPEAERTASSAVPDLLSRIAEGFAAVDDVEVLDVKERAVLVKTGGHKLMVGVQLCP